MWGSFWSPQGSVSRPLLFLIYLNDLLDILLSKNMYFAEDGTIVKLIAGVADQLNNDLLQISQWCDAWGMVVNWQKSKVMNITRVHEDHILR